MASEDVAVGPMTASFVVWRCLHGGPVARASIEMPRGDGPSAGLDWSSCRATNVALIARLIRTYRTCAILAKDGEAAVGFLRFDPKAIASRPTTGGLCLQQAYPNGATEGLVDEPFPRLSEIDDKTLLVRCLTTASPKRRVDPYQRRGLAKRMVGELARWGRERHRQAIQNVSRSSRGLEAEAGR